MAITWLKESALIDFALTAERTILDSVATGIWDERYLARLAELSIEIHDFPAPLLRNIRGIITEDVVVPSHNNNLAHIFSGEWRIVLNRQVLCHVEHDEASPGYLNVLSNHSAAILPYVLLGRRLFDEAHLHDHYLQQLLNGIVVNLYEYRSITRH